MSQRTLWSRRSSTTRSAPEGRARPGLDENRELKMALAMSEARVASLASNLDETNKRARAWEEHYRRVARERDGLRTNVDQLKAQGESYNLRIAQLERDLAYTAKRRQEADELLQRRTAELRDAEAYLTLIDDVADSEVVQIVEHLNGQIFQCAALISDAPVFSSNGRHDGKASEAARTRLSQASSLGADLLASLSDVASGKDSTLVQVALQAGMAEYARRLGNTWDISAVDRPATIGDIYLKIRENGTSFVAHYTLPTEHASEPQAVAGKWRILCRKYTKLLRGRAEDSTRTWFDALSSMVTDILIVCGAAGTLEKLRELVVREYGSELQGVLKLALQFQRTAGERVVSSDFTILAAKPGAAFDATQMEDARATAGAPATPPSTNEVLCTTELGLEKTMGEPRRGNEPQATGIHSTVLKRCKVVLVEDLDIQSIYDSEYRSTASDSDIGSEWPQERIAGDVFEHVPVYESMAYRLSQPS
ncbi:hypothetical protein C8Q74DRAFT_367972 [Fomes fomentarius]|nr:hypothetical protein C8Q74DRAFT_367972 [Fomes fomentarius]